MKKVVRLTESDLVRIVRRVIKEQEKELDEDWGDDVLGAITGVGGYVIDTLFGSNDTWKKIVSSASPLYGVLGSQTGKQSLKALFNSSPAGIIKNMSIAAANGDAKSLTQAFNQAMKYSKYDLSQIKNAAFKDMKTFGKLLKTAGVK